MRYMHMNVFTYRTIATNGARSVMISTVNGTSLGRLKSKPDGQGQMSIGHHT